MHQDHVPTVPESFHVLGSTSICPNQGFVKFIPSADNDTSSSDLISPQSLAILTFQGHPEFTSGLVNKNLDGKLEKGTICKELIGRSREAANDHEDGVKIGRVILEMMGF
jgi:GMP synthase-like glutamine amidotransferase